MRSHGQFNKGVDARRNDTGLRRAEPGRPGRLGVRPLAARVLTAVLLAAFAALLALPAQAQLPDDATLSALTVSAGTSDVDLLNPGFISIETSYRTAVKYRDERLTVTATTTIANATIDFLDRSDAILDDADSMTSGHQMDVPVGVWMFKVRVIAQDHNTKVYEVVVERDSAHLFGWTPTRDLNGLAAAGNESPQGIWSDGTTIWVADDEDNMLYAYTLATGVRDASKEFSLHTDNGNPKGIWSDGTTVWVADDEDDKLYAYALSDGTRQDGTNSTVNEEFSLHTDNGAPWGIWSDGTIIWVTNGADPILYAYTLAGGTRQTDIEFLLNGKSLVPRGIWSDGSTLWVSSSAYSSTKPLMAYTLDFSSTAVGNLHGVPDRGKSFYTPGTLQLMGAGIWSDGDTAIWMASAGPAGKIYSFNTLPSKSGGVSLSSLTVSAGNGGEVRFRPPGFNINDVVHWASVVNDVNVVTVSAIASDTAAMVEYVDKDGNQIAPGQVDVMEGRSHLIGILVTAPDGAALIHQVFVERDSARSGGWTPTKDILGLDAAGITTPTGIWSDGDTMWVVDYRDLKLYAYTLDTGLRDESKEFDLDSANNNPWGLWSDGKTIWVGSRSTVNLKLFAYTLKDDTTTTGTDEKGQRDATKDITLDASNTAASGIWSNGTDTVWVVDQSQDKLYAYTLDIVDGMEGTSHGERKEASDISLQDQGLHYGIWSDGTTVWVGNNGTKSFRAYTLANGEQEESKDIPFAPFHGNTQGVWSNGSTLWSADSGDSRIYSHTLPGSEGATTLSNLTVTPSPEVSSFTATLRPTFSSDTDIYGVAVPNAVEFVTISPTLSDISATVAYQDEGGGTLADADQNALGHQVNVPVGTFVINIKITKTDEPSITYTIYVERDSAERFGWTPTKDFNTFYQNNSEAAGEALRAVWGDETTLYVATTNKAKLFAFSRSDGTRVEGKDIVTSSDFPLDGNGQPESIIFAGIWSDGTTIWVVDYYRVHDEDGMDYEPRPVEQAHGKLFAYSLNGGARDKNKEFVLDSIHHAGVRGVWSNGTTVWVSDYKLDQLIAYTLGTGARVQDSDITLHSDNAVPQGIWSDGTTIWVADWDDDKFYAYLLDTGARAESKDFSLAPGNGYPRDVWSDGTTIWVPDAVADKLFSYRMTDGTTTTPGVSVSETALTVTEEDATGGSYTVVLDSLPTADVVVTIAGHSGTAVTPTPTTLTFATSNWNTAQTVTVTAGDDTDTTTDMVTLTHSATSTDGSYDGITIASVTVTVNDNDDDTAAGICGRTPAVLDALLALIPGVSDCAAVTAAELAAITGTLDLSSQSITALAAGDFAGLTALKTLNLFNNELTSLPDDVFAGLTALETLNLDHNKLTTLPGGVFGGLTALKLLYLNNNMLTALPDDVFGGLTALEFLYLGSNELTALPTDVFGGLTALKLLYLNNNRLDALPNNVFEPLTALKALQLRDNPGALFAPTADARPDDGTVPVAGGKVTLDGSGSSGPWGTNVTYRWALTTPANGVTVMFDDARSVTPEVTIPALAEDTELTFTLTVTGRGGTNGINTDTDTAKVTATLNITNNPPMFAGGPAQGRTLAETVGNATVGTAAAIGAPVSASDVDTGDTLTYVLLGADQDKFIFDTSSGQIKTKVGEKYDYEAKPSYSVTVTVNDGTVTVSAAVTISVTDQNEAPLASDAPVASATSGNTTSLEVSWTAPDNTGRPGITSYDLQYQVQGASSWTNGPQDVSGTSASITGLVPDTEYEVQVRATNAEGDGAWSVAGGGTTGTTTPGITVSETALTVTEEDATGGSYTVVLDSLPTADVVVTVDGHSGTAVTPTPTTLTFATSNWNTAQTVTVTAGDDTDTTTDMVTLTHSATSTDGSYDGITIASVTVTVTDNDTANLVVSTSTLTVDEAGSDTFTVKLATQPSAGVTVAVTSDDTGAATASPASLTFTTGNWDTTQTVTVSGVDDSDAAAESVTVSLNASGGDYSDIMIASVTVTVNDNDDDTAAGICGRTPAVLDALLALIPGVSDCAAVTAAELAAITGTLDLSSQSITALAAGDFAGLTALKTLNLFNNELTMLPDDVFAGLTALETLNLDHNKLTTLPGGVFGGLTALKTLYLNNNMLTALPDDVFGGLTALEFLYLGSNELTALPTDVFGGLTALKLLYLNNNRLDALPNDVFEPLTALKALQLRGNREAPFAPVADARPDDGTVPVAGGKVTLDGSDSSGPWGTNVTYRWALTTPASGVTVTFDNATSAMPEVTIPALTEGIELTFTLTVTGRGGTNGIATGIDTATVTVTARPTTPGVTVSETALTVTEEDTAGASYTVVLDSLPTADVVVTVDGHSGTAVTPTPTTLTFATSNWNTAQTVTVTAGDDTDTTTDMVTLTHSATSTDGSYDGITIASVTVTVTDNDTANLVVSTSTLTVDEAGSDTFTVKLATQPSAGVTVAVTSDDTGAATASPASLTFTTGNWDTTQTVTVSGVDDSDAAAESVTVSLNASGGDYSDIMIASVTVTVNDNDDDTAAGICGRTPAVRDALLALIPSVSDCAAVTAAELAAITGTLDLSSQSITALAAGDFAELTALEALYLNNNDLTSLPGEVFGGLTTLMELDLAFNALTTLPDDVFEPLTVLTDLYLNNNDLTSLPGEVFGGLTTLMELDLAFNALTMLPAGVFAGLTSLETLSLSNNKLTTLPGNVFEPLTALKALRLSFNDGAPFAPKAVALPDNGTVPVAGGVVTLDGSGSGGPWGTNVTYGWALTTPASGATFDNDTSATPEVTIQTLAEDTVLTFTLTVIGRGGTDGIDTGIDTATVTVTARPTTPGVTVSETALTVTEGDATGDSYTVVLDSQPTADVTVTVGGHAGTEVTPTPTSLTFTTSNWDTAQTVTVTAGNDTDTTDDEVTLTHSADSDYSGISIASVTVTVTDNAAGICERTPEVRDALLALIPGVSDCADVTDAHLAAITGTLDLAAENITALAAGDFAELTALEALYLNGNKLTSLPDDVFDGLTSLTKLNLDHNKLTSLPGGVFAGLTLLKVLLLNDNKLTVLPDDVFAGLTMLEVLLLNSNDLTTLPDDVFEPLTSLKVLYLADNREAPFAPTADALPDDGTVPVGGTVRLNGSGSDGGPWGKNVSYHWELTTPARGVTVMFDYATSATPVVTIPELKAGTELTFTLTVIGRGGTNTGIDTAADTAKVTVSAAIAATGQ